MKRFPDKSHTRKLELNILAIIDAFLDQKRVNVFEHTVKTVPHGAVFTVCSYTFNHIKGKPGKVKW